MDDNSRRRRPNEPQYSGSDPRFNSETQGRGFSSSSSAERYRPAPLTSSPSAARGPGGASAYPGYYQEQAASFSAPLPSNPNMQYQSGYAQEPRQQQSFASYNPELMYSVSQQAPPNPVYDPTPQFQARQPAAMQMLSDVAAPYFPNEPTSAPGPPSLQHHASSGSSYQQHQQSTGDGRPILQQSYSGNMGMAGMQSAPEIMEEEDFQAQGPGMEAAHAAYQTALKEIFQNIIHGRLADASTSLLEVSEWLLGHVGDLGLTVDEVTLHGDRIRLWGEFNTAWLSIFQKQKDMLESGQRIGLISKEFISKMAKDLIRMCDAVEKHGLVDYQYGVAEEQIIMIIEECLDLQESIEGVGVGGPATGRAPP